MDVELSLTGHYRNQKCLGAGDTRAGLPTDVRTHGKFKPT